MVGAISPLSQYAFMAWCSVKAEGHLYLYQSLRNYDENENTFPSVKGCTVIRGN